MFALKSVKQYYKPNPELCSMMDTFMEMVNCCIRIGFENNISTMKKLSVLSYCELSGYDIPSYYKLTAISQAAGRLASMRRSIKRGVKVKSPFVARPYLVSCYGFKINGMLLSIPAKNRDKILIPLNRHVASKISEEGIELRSFTITPELLSISIRKQVQPVMPQNAIGIDRNLRNVTIFDGTKSLMYRTDKLLSIKENTNHVISSFRRYDTRVKKHYQKRLGNRRTRRVQQFLHKISKDIVQRAAESRSIILFEDLRGIRKLYRKGNGQGNKYRRKLNSWSFYELQRQVEYKAAWSGVPVKYIDPRRTSVLCPICGERIQEDRQNRRKVLCINCGKMMDRDVVASMNVYHKGWSRLCHPRGLSGEAVRGNVEYVQPLILRVDGSKLAVGINRQGNRVESTLFSDS